MTESSKLFHHYLCAWESVVITQWDSSLSVLPMARVVITQWDSSLAVLPVARAQFPATVKYCKGFFPGDPTLPTRPELAWQKMTQFPPMAPRDLWTARPKFNHGKPMADRKKCA